MAATLVIRLHMLYRSVAPAPRGARSTAPDWPINQRLSIFARTTCLDGASSSRLLPLSNTGNEDGGVGWRWCWPSLVVVGVREMVGRSMSTSVHIPPPPSPPLSRSLDSSFLLFSVSRSAFSFFFFFFYFLKPLSMCGWV